MPRYGTSNLLPCEICKDLGSDPVDLDVVSGSDTRHSLTIRIDDLNSSCRFCSTLVRMVQHFASNLDQTESSAFIYIQFDRGKAASVEVYDYPDDFMRSRAKFYLFLKVRSSINTGVVKLTTKDAMYSAPLARLSRRVF